MNKREAIKKMLDDDMMVNDYNTGTFHINEDGDIIRKFNQEIGPVNPVHLHNDGWHTYVGESKHIETMYECVNDSSHNRWFFGNGTFFNFDTQEKDSEYTSGHLKRKTGRTMQINTKTGEVLGFGVEE